MKPQALCFTYKIAYLNYLQLHKTDVYFYDNISTEYWFAKS